MQLFNPFCFEQEEGKGGEISLKDFKQGQVQQLDLEEVFTTETPFDNF